MSAEFTVKRTPVVIVGSGVAGLALANALGEAIIVTAGRCGHGGSTRWSQGGIAAAVGGNDSAKLHAGDTKRVSSGLTIDSVVEAVTQHGADVIESLMYLGARFDTEENGELSLGREAGHSVRRIVKANGDSIGAEISRAAREAVMKNDRIEVVEASTVTSVVLSEAGDEVIGVKVESASDIQIILAAEVVLATGGYSYVWEKTTNPNSSIGSGLHLAAQAGAQLADLEFVQFHPTALNVDTPGQLPLVTEAIRGEGAHLVNANGERYMAAIHPDAELAPRDVVARANYSQIVDGLVPKLDSTEALGERFADHFPGVNALAVKHGFEPANEALPITPAAHYCMGGVVADVTGKTSMKGLRAIGELASTGLHGANRLASNSLLEGLVMGALAAKDITENRRLIPKAGVCKVMQLDGDDMRGLTSSEGGALVVSDEVCEEIRSIMWRHVGLVRTETGLMAGIEKLKSLQPQSHRAQVMHSVALLVANSALARQESRGAHYRADFPEAGDVEERSFVEALDVDSANWVTLDATKVKTG